VITGLARVNPRRVFALTGTSAFDQALSALSNFVITLAVVRGGGPEALGHYSVAFAVYLIVLGVSRALVSEPLLAARREEDQVRDGLSASLTAVLAIAVVSGVGVGGYGLLMGQPALVAVAVALPITLVQDVLRYQAFWLRRPNVAVLLDGGWVLGAILTWPILATHSSATTAVLCWAGASMLGTALAIPALRPRLAGPEATREWWHCKARRLAGPMAVESIVYGVSAQAVIFLVAAVLGAGDLGVLRAGQVYFMPVAMALAGCESVAIPHLAQGGVQIRSGIIALLAAGMSLFALISSLVVIAAEPLLHTVLYASAVEVPRLLLVPLAAQVVLAACSSAFVIAVKVRQSGRDLVVARLFSAGVGLVVLFPATMYGGVQGAAWALALHALLHVIYLGSRTLRPSGQETRSPDLQK